MVTIYFVDTSALAKRYFTEAGSTWVLSWIEPAANNTIVIAELALIEMRSVLARRVRGGLIANTNATQLRADFAVHVQNQYLTVLLDRDIVLEAARLVDTHGGLRTLDSIQLACALQARSVLGSLITFISADINLLTAADVEGFAVDNPNTHP